MNRITYFTVTFITMKMGGHKTIPQSAVLIFLITALTPILT